MIKRVAVVKFGMDNGCGDGTSCFRLDALALSVIATATWLAG